MPEMKKTPMREQDPKVRARNYDEVTLGYSEQEALAEAERCLQCKKPFCKTGCPVGVPIPEFIGAIKDKDFEKAAAIIKSTNNLPAICGRACPQEEQCEKLCVLAKKGESVGIGRLERFIGDYALTHAPKTDLPEFNGHKVAIVGSGPAGLTCAADLARLGYKVTVFEAFHEAGGVLIYGIPEFRLPKDLVKKEIDNLKAYGVEFVLNAVIGKTLTVEDLFADGYEAVFIGSGAGLPKFMNIPGENLIGVYSANEYLTRINLMKAYKNDSKTPIKRGHKVAVVGGGNVAMDSARWALRLGADEVHIVYRRSMEEMPARVEEVHHAKDEGIIFDTLVNPVEILGADGRVAGLRCIKMELGEPDSSGRRSPKAIPGSEFIMDADIVIMAIGTTPNPLISATTEGLQINKYGCLIVNEETMETTRQGVYAGGDAVTGAATVILAMGAGKKAAKSIDDYLKKQ